MPCVDNLAWPRVKLDCHRPNGCDFHCHWKLSSSEKGHVITKLECGDAPTHRWIYIPIGKVINVKVISLIWLQLCHKLEFARSNNDRKNRVFVEWEEISSILQKDSLMNILKRKTGFENWGVACDNEMWTFPYKHARGCKCNRVQSTATKPRCTCESSCFLVSFLSRYLEYKIQPETIE